MARRRATPPPGVTTTRAQGASPTGNERSRRRSSTANAAAEGLRSRRQGCGRFTRSRALRESARRVGTRRARYCTSCRLEKEEQALTSGTRYALSGRGGICMFSRPLVLTFSLLALQLSLAPAVATSAEAQGQTQPISKYRFQALDDNKAGRITRDEWDGNDRSFRNHDWNGDGVLSGNEVRPGAQRDTDLAHHNPNQCERDLNWTRANFTSLDHNRHGRLSANEWHFDMETFRR